MLIRHGQPARLPPGDDSDPPLTDLGLEQARIVAARLSKESPEALITSHLLRARQTGEPVAAAVGRDLQENRAVSEVDADGARYVHVEDLRDQAGEAWASFLKDPIGTLGGDELEFKSRVLDGFAHILDEYKDARRVAVFTHGFPINVILAKILRIDSITRFLPAHGSITRIAGRRIDNLAIVSVNEMGHFPIGDL